MLHWTEIKKNKTLAIFWIISTVKITMSTTGKGASGGSKTGRGGSTIGAPKALKRDYQLVSPTTPEGQVTLCNIRALLKEAIEPLADDLEQVKQKLDAITVVNARVDTLELKVDNIETRLLQSETKCSELQKEVVKLEMYSRKNNLKFLNIKDPHSASNENCEEKILDLCAYHNVELDARDIETAHRLGRSTKIDRPIMVKFSNFKSKQKILRARKTFQTQNIKVAEDFSTAIQQRRRIFSPILQEIFRSGGKYRGKLVQDKLLLNDRLFAVEDLNNLPEDLKLDKISTKTRGDMVVFFSKNSKFSNHYPCNFSKDGITFKSVEQYLMFSKAKCFKDNTTTDLILKTDDPVQAKLLGKRISNFQMETWSDIRNTYMEKGLSAKFSQNPELRQALEDTGSKTLVEANPKDKYWGAGLSLECEEVWEPHNWKGKNMLGKLLVELRQTF